MIDLSQVVRRQRLPIELVFEIAANMIVGRHNVTGRERAHCTVVKAEHLIPLRRLHWRSPRALTGTTVERVPPIAASTAWAVRPIELVVMLLPVQSRSPNENYCNGILHASFTLRGSSGRPATVSATVRPHFSHLTDHLPVNVMARSSIVTMAAGFSVGHLIA